MRKLTQLITTIAVLLLPFIQLIGEIEESQTQLSSKGDTITRNSSGWNFHIISGAARLQQKENSITELRQENFESAQQQIHLLGVSHHHSAIQSAQSSSSVSPLYQLGGGLFIRAGGPGFIARSEKENENSTPDSDNIVPIFLPGDNLWLGVDFCTELRCLLLFGRKKSDSELLDQISGARGSIAGAQFHFSIENELPVQVKVIPLYFPLLSGDLFASGSFTPRPDPFRIAAFQRRWRNFSFRQNDYAGRIELNTHYRYLLFALYHELYYIYNSELGEHRERFTASGGGVALNYSADNWQLRAFLNLESTRGSYLAEPFPGNYTLRELQGYALRSGLEFKRGRLGVILEFFAPSENRTAKFRQIGQAATGGFLNQGENPARSSLFQNGFDNWPALAYCRDAECNGIEERRGEYRMRRGSRIFRLSGRLETNQLTFELSNLIWKPTPTESAPLLLDAMAKNRSRRHYYHEISLQLQKSFGSGASLQLGYSRLLASYPTESNLLLAQGIHFNYTLNFAEE